MHPDIRHAPPAFEEELHSVAVPPVMNPSRSGDGHNLKNGVETTGRSERDKGAQDDGWAIAWQQDPGTPALPRDGAASAQYAASAHFAGRSPAGGEEIKGLRLEFGSQYSGVKTIGRGGVEGAPSEKVYGRARRREAASGQSAFSGFISRRQDESWNPYETDATRGIQARYSYWQAVVPRSIVESEETAVGRDRSSASTRLAIPPLWGPDMPDWDQEVPPYLRDETIDADNEQ